MEIRARREGSEAGGQSGLWIQRTHVQTLYYTQPVGPLTLLSSRTVTQGFPWHPSTDSVSLTAGCVPGCSGGSAANPQGAVAYLNFSKETAPSV